MSPFFSCSHNVATVCHFAFDYLSCGLEQVQFIQSNGEFHSVSWYNFQVNIGYVREDGKDVSE